jgi:hypothetical protein
LPNRSRYVLILAHMRSGSTLLGHLLLQHPRIAGASERNAAYRTRAGFRQLETDAYLAQRRFVRRAELFVDQLNHRRFLDDPALLRPPSVRPIFLIRRPAEAIASMVDVLGRHYGFTRDDAIAYYTERCGDLARLAAALPKGHAAWLRFEALTHDTEGVLDALARYLELPPPALTASYPTHRFTGGAGDPSVHIASGRVGPAKCRTIELSHHERDRLESVYGETSATLSAHCQALDAVSFLPPPARLGKP